MRSPQWSPRRRWRLLVAGAQALPLLVACTAPDGKRAAAAVPTLAFGAPLTLSAVTEVGAAPILAIAPDGRQATAWVSAPNGGTLGRLYVSVADSTGAPGEPGELVDPLGPIEPHGEAPPKLAWARRAGGGMTLGALYVVGRVVPGRRFPMSALRYVRSDDGGHSWSAPVTVTDDPSAVADVPADFGSHNFHALHAAPDGTLYVAWLDGRHGKSATYLTHSTDGGRSWAPNVRVVPPTSRFREACPCCRTAIAAGADGAVYLAWRAVLPVDTAGGAVREREAVPAPSAPAPGGAPHAGHGAPAGPTVRDIVVARSADRGATWGEPVRVQADDWVFDGCPHAGPSLAVDDGGTLHVAWWTGKTGAAGVHYAHSTDGGRTFGGIQPLGVAQASRPAHVQLAALSRAGAPSLVVAAWDDGTRRVPQVVVRASHDGGAHFAPAVPISEDTQAAGFPVLGLMPQGEEAQVVVAWSEQAQGAAEQAEQARPDMRNPNAVMGLPSVGAMQVRLRRGLLRGAAAPRAAAADAFRPLQVGDAAPTYSAFVVAGAGAGAAVPLGGAGPVRLVNVWATWCTSCREEMADLDTLYRTYRDRGLAVVAVSVDQGSPDKVRRYATSQQLAMAVAHDPAGTIQGLFGVVGVPETYLIDRTGQVVWKLAGNVHGAVPAARAAIEQALGAASVRTAVRRPPPAPVSGSAGG
jgi:peroxiredoxin